MSARLTLFKSFEFCSAYCLEDFPGALDSQWRSRVDEVCGFLQNGASSFVLFDLPQDVVPQLAHEQIASGAKRRIAPLHSCQTLFPTIWQESTDFGGDFAVFAVERDADETAVMQQLLRRFSKRPWGISTEKMIDFHEEFVRWRRRPTLIMEKVDDGMVILVVSSVEFIGLVRSIMSTFHIQTKVDEPNVIGK